ncbi:hypothetical protein [Mesorhizobium sp. RMAD-H1]|uniref:hypothetical protein n=1 Tax=Mesorhizobium sp. RMAD-H1 TaxID=2587065 RepID=UPI00161A3878|nr:hypothetical protein [Mesorhizobium sp. RMAD-H1]MBB2969712.1 hypothetical protein [Mesorhizobium sp. RMAD-H1]
MDGQIQKSKYICLSIIIVYMILESEFDNSWQTITPKASPQTPVAWPMRGKREDEDVTKMAVAYRPERQHPASAPEAARSE